MTIAKWKQSVFIKVYLLNECLYSDSTHRFCNNENKSFNTIKKNNNLKFIQH